MLAEDILLLTIFAMAMGFVRGGPKQSEINIVFGLEHAIFMLIPLLNITVERERGKPKLQEVLFLQIIFPSLQILLMTMTKNEICPRSSKSRLTNSGEKLRAVTCCYSVYLLAASAKLEFTC